MNGLHHFFDGEIFTDKVLTAPPKCLPKGGIICEMNDFFGQVFQIAGLNQKSSLAVETNFPRAVAIVGDDGLGGGERLRQRTRQSFAQRQMNERVHDADVFWNFIWRNKAGENKMAFELEGTSQIFKTRAVFAVADKEEFYFWILPDKFRRDGKQIIMAFEFDEPRNGAYDEIIRRDPKFFPQIQIVFYGEKRFEREAAENFYVLFSAANADGEILGFHGFGDDDEVVGDAGGFFFCGAENKIAQTALKIPERRAVNGMNDDGHARASRGEASKNPGFAAVGVDDVRFLFAKDFFQAMQCEPIIQRMNRADEFGNNQ